MRALERLSPVQVGLLGSGIAVVVVVLRLLVAADGDVSRFVVAGDEFADAGAVDPRIHVVEGSTGYDGQFFWRLAVDPAEWDLAPAHGVRLDSAYRPPRIGYPVLAWLAAAGQPGLVAWSLVGVNVAAAGAVAGLGAAVARRADRPPLWGLLVASAPGLLMALGRDLAEVVTLAAVMGGVVAVQRGRPGLAALAWSGAVLSREQALVVVAGYGLWRLAELVTARRGRRAGAAWDELPWLVPPLVTVAWQGVLWAHLGELPAAAASGSNLTLPFAELVPALGRWAQGDLARLDILTPVQLLLAAALVVTALRQAAPRLPAPDRWLVVSLALVSLAAVSLARSVWEGPAGLRHASDVFALAWVALLGGTDRLPQWLVAGTALVWLGTAALLVAAI